MRFPIVREVDTNYSTRPAVIRFGVGQVTYSGSTAIITITGGPGGSGTTLPLPEGSTNYAGYRSTFTFQQPQTFLSSTTMSGSFYIVTQSTPGFVYSTGTIPDRYTRPFEVNRSTLYSRVPVFLNPYDVAGTMTHGTDDLASFNTSVSGSRYIILRNHNSGGEIGLNFGNDNSNLVNVELMSKGQTASQDPGLFYLDFNGNTVQSYGIFDSWSHGRQPQFYVQTSSYMVAIGTDAPRARFHVMASTSMVHKNLPVFLLTDSAANDFVRIDIASTTFQHPVIMSSITAYGTITTTSPVIFSSSIVGDIAVATLVIDSPTVSPGVAGDLFVPFNCTISSVVILANQSGSIVFDIWRDDIGNFPPTVADTITAADKPTLSAAQTYTNATLSGWTLNANANDTLRFNVDSVSGISRVTLAVIMKRRL